MSKLTASTCRIFQHQQSETEIQILFTFFFLFTTAFCEIYLLTNLYVDNKLFTLHISIFCACSISSMVNSLGTLRWRCKAPSRRPEVWRWRTSKLRPSRSSPSARRPPSRVSPALWSPPPPPPPQRQRPPPSRGPRPATSRRTSPWVWQCQQPLFVGWPSQCFFFFYFSFTCYKFDPVSYSLAVDCPLQPSINTTNIDTLLVATDQTERIVEPPENVQEKIAFIFNNLSQSNMTQKVR